MGGTRQLEPAIQGPFRPELAQDNRVRRRMNPLFLRHVGVDWSGAGKSDRTARGLAIAEYRGERSEVVRWHASRRSREEAIEWLKKVLAPDLPPTVVGMDFSFGFPVGALSKVFGVTEWRDLAVLLKHMLAAEGTAFAVAQQINAKPQFNGHGPFRLNETRNDFRFYLANEVPYYRLVENFVPQAISAWYLGSGSTVGYSTITGIAALGHLLASREHGLCDFRVHPFEPIEKGVHVLAEVYPSIWPKPVNAVFRDDHERDAIRIAIALAAITPDDFVLPSRARADGRVREEGWILGVK